MAKKKTPTLEDLKPAPHNARAIGTEALEALGTSIAEFGDIAGITWNRRTGHLVAGHQRLRSLREKHGEQLRMARGIIRTPDGETFRVRVVDWPLAKEKAATIAANSPELAGVFTKDVAEVLAELEGTMPELSADLRFDELLETLNVGPAADADVVEDEDVPAPPTKTIAKLGDVWNLGEHVLVCGDARDEDLVVGVVGEDSASCLWTDPPYGVGYTGVRTPRKAIANDENDGNIGGLLEDAFAVADAVLMPGAAVYIFHPAGALSVTFATAFLGAGWRLRQTLVWLKQSMVISHGDYHYRHEPILFGYTDGGGRRGRGAAGWYGGSAETSVIEIPRPDRSPGHPTMKPVRLAARMIGNSSAAGETVFDPFLGSGTVMIAAEQLGRRCVGVELEPGYCDVTVERWQRLTGGKAKRRRRA